MDRALRRGGLSYRVGKPIRDTLRHRLRVARVVSEAPGLTSVYLTGDRLGELRAESGQFFMRRFLTRDGWWQAHPYSRSAAPNGRWLRLTVKDLGDHSSIEQASALLAASGAPDHAIDGGGDVRLRGDAGPTCGRRWQVALRHPFQLDAFCAVVTPPSGWGAWTTTKHS